MKNCGEIFSPDVLSFVYSSGTRRESEMRIQLCRGRRLAPLHTFPAALSRDSAANEMRRAGNPVRFDPNAGAAEDKGGRSRSGRCDHAKLVHAGTLYVCK